MSASILRKSKVFLNCVNSSVVNCRNLKSIVPIKWVRPEKIPCYKAEKSGDLKPLEYPNCKQYPLEFRDSEELKTADETVKQLFSLEYFPHKKTVEVVRKDYLDRVRRHPLDSLSPEARVAKMTADIRDMQKRVEICPKSVRTRVHLKEVIDKRKKLLKYLRTWDYKCFEWVLEKLDLFYKPFPPQTVYKRVERKHSLRMLTDKYCENIINNRLEDYKKSLEVQQIEFLEEKIKNLKWIMKEEHDCGLQPTISEFDVKMVEDKLEELKKLRANNSSDQK